jgi:DNA-binding XRE family transcriptional regulator
MKGPNLQRIWDELSEDRKEKIKLRSKELLAEYNTLQELRQALELSQCDIAETLQVHQVNISKIENRDDMKLSTLRDYLSSLGGQMRIIVDFPGKDSIILKGFSDKSSGASDGTAHA